MPIATGLAILGSALIGGAASAISGSKQASAAKSGAATQAQSDANALALQKQEFDTQQANLAPWQKAGSAALGQQSDLLGLNGAAAQTNAFGQFQTDPGYQFAFNQGQKAVQSSAAARGILNSGATAKALTTFGQGIADQQYGNYYDRLAGVSGTGLQATNSANAAGTNYANSSGNLLQAQGQARASGYLGAANAFSNAAGGFATAANTGIQNYLSANNPFGGGYGYSPQPVQTTPNVLRAGLG